jgi:hypothetical protein
MFYLRKSIQHKHENMVNLARKLSKSRKELLVTLGEWTAQTEERSIECSTEKKNTGHDQSSSHATSMKHLQLITYIPTPVLHSNPANMPRETPLLER